MKIGIATPTAREPVPAWLSSVAASAPVLRASGHDMTVRIEAGPYIDFNRQKMLHDLLEDGCDAVVFVDDDLEWQPDALLRLLEAAPPVCGADYRFRQPEERYMGALAADEAGFPIPGPNSTIKALRLPAGFLRVKREAVERFALAYPDLCYGGHVGLFAHGPIGGAWFGEDMAFCKRWTERCGDLWALPDITLTHHDRASGEAYTGNLASFLRRQPGGSEDPMREAA